MSQPIELAQLEDGQLVYGTFPEIEQWAEDHDTCVEHYFDHVNPSTVYKKFVYVGNSLHNPYSVSTPYDYDSKKPGNFSQSGVNLDKW